MSIFNRPKVLNKKPIVPGSTYPPTNTLPSIWSPYVPLQTTNAIYINHKSLKERETKQNKSHYEPEKERVLRYLSSALLKYSKGHSQYGYHTLLASKYGYHYDNVTKVHKVLPILTQVMGFHIHL